MWNDGDKLMMWNEGAKDWIEAPIGLSVAVRNAPEWRRQRRRSLLRDSVLMGLLLAPLAALGSAVVHRYGGRTLGNVWFFALLGAFIALSYWVIRDRS